MTGGNDGLKPVPRSYQLPRHIRPSPRAGGIREREGEGEGEDRGGFPVTTNCRLVMPPAGGG